ncbi:MAG: ROK family protein [Acutalibacter sp.]|nr:ROK family protein [Acutalibacter sp.]
MNTISIDLGGSRVKMGVVSDGKIVTSAMIESNSQAGLQPLLPKLEEVCKDWIKEYFIEAAGFAFPSLVDAKNKKILGHNGKYPDCAEVDLKSWTREKLGLSMVIENDANAAALGEGKYGSAAGCENFVLMILGTGIGTAAVMDGKLIRGKHSQAGVLLGHTPLKVNGRPCAGCPGIGCAEAQASTWALKHMVEESPKQSPLKKEKQIDFQVLQRYWEQNDPLAIELFEECCAYWANCLITLVYAYDPELIVLSGGVLGWGPALTERMIGIVKERVWTPWGEPAFRLAADPEASVLLGLHALCENEMKESL